MEFGASILGTELSVDGGLSGVAVDGIGADGLRQSRVIGVASLEAGSGQHAELNLRHPFGQAQDRIQPTGVLGRVVEPQPLHDASGLASREGLVKGGHAVGVQSLPRTRYGVVEDPTPQWCVGVSHVHQPLHLVGEVHHGAPLGDGQVAPARPGFTGQEDVASARPAMLIVFPSAPMSAISLPQ